VPSVPFLLYHKVDEIPPGVRHPEIYVTPSRFAEQLAILQRLRMNPVTVADYVAYRRGEATLPPRPVVITFDDGYRSNYEVAFPILQRFGYRATIFVVSSLFGGTNVWDPQEPQEPLLERCEIRAMQRAGIDFQSHTRTHARLTAVPPAEALCQLRTSRCALEQTLGAPVRAVAYPWGAHDATVLQLAEEAGYDAGCIVRRRTNFDRTPMLALRRIGVWCSTTHARFAWDLLRLRFRGD
jgi:peptidoglycan/xylan/chitin deacetylase (PgdA/CDA1 family)